jgi:hypothetical protein
MDYVNEWVTVVPLLDVQTRALKEIYLQRGMRQDQNLGRELLAIGGTSIVFAEAAYDIAQGVALTEETGITILGNGSQDIVEEVGQQVSESTPLVLGFMGCYGTDEVTFRARQTLVATDKILKNLGVDFRFTS